MVDQQKKERGGQRSGRCVAISREGEHLCRRHGSHVKKGSSLGASSDWGEELTYISAEMRPLGSLGAITRWRSKRAGFPGKGVGKAIRGEGRDSKKEGDLLMSVGGKRVSGGVAREGPSGGEKTKLQESV